jgi:hypothetical protein
MRPKSLPRRRAANSWVRSNQWPVEQGLVIVTRNGKAVAALLAVRDDDGGQDAVRGLIPGLALRFCRGAGSFQRHSESFQRDSGKFSRSP